MLRVGIRAVGALGRLLLAVIVTKNLPQSESHSILFFISSISVFMIFLQMGIAYNNHKLIVTAYNNQRLAEILSGQFGAHLSCYMLVLPVVYLYAQREIYSGIVICAILACDHFMVEVATILNSRAKYISSALVIAMRQIFPVLSLFTYMFFYDINVASTVFQLWLVSQIASLIIIFIFLLYKTDIISIIRNIYVDKNLITSGVTVTVGSFLGLVFFGFDRFVVKEFLTTEDVAQYSLLFSCYSVVLFLLQATIFPEQKYKISAIDTKDNFISFLRHKIAFNLLLSLITSCILSLVFYYCWSTLFFNIDRPSALEFIFFIVNTVAYVVNVTLSFSLQALFGAKKLVKSNSMGAVFFIILLGVGVTFDVISIVFISATSSAAFFVVLLAKYRSVNKLLNELY